MARSQRLSEIVVRRESVSVICVFNDPEVRRHCLDRSLEEHCDEATVEYLPIDNTDGAFATAGAALNHGASLASNEYLAFVHQDVYLHSLSALEAAAGILAEDESIGVLGALGVSTSGAVTGRIRDRVLLLGESAPIPTDVDSLDEVLFMVPRRLVQREPLAEATELAWHAYAVEYGLRVRRLGRRVCAMDLPLTHNSLTVNLTRLDVAYRAVAAMHPDALPVRTTGGTIGTAAPPRPDVGLLGPHRWRYRWLRESIAVRAARRAAGGGPCVLSDIRRDIDDVLALDSGSPLLVVSVDNPRSFFDTPDPLELLRRDRPITVTSRGAGELTEMIRGRPASHSMLLTNLRIAELTSIGRRLDAELRLIGFRREIGYWMLVGPAAAAAPRQWRIPKAKPLGMARLARAS
jgi:hypothetical protein